MKKQRRAVFGGTFYPPLLTPNQQVDHRSAEEALCSNIGRASQGTAS